jgi:subtilisin family serine protease
MKYILLFVFVFLLFAFHAKAQNYYWIAFNDKSSTEYSLSHPEVYLSQRAIERRERQNIPIDSLDLPVNSNYIDSVLTLDVTLKHASKWLNGITVSTDLEGLDTCLVKWDFVKEVQLTKPSLSTKSALNKFSDEIELDESAIDTSLYGESVYQVGMLEGQYLHKLDYKGEGMQIAVLDAGFYKVDEYAAFDSLWANNQILGTRDFVDPNSNIYTTNYHGMSVLSCMGGNIPGQLIGTAPQASFWLLRSEEIGSEYIIEEDNWVVAAEFADSVGVDIINTSLGYYEFDDSQTNHVYDDMDGNTTRVTQGANIAASRGILVFASAGNERDNAWKRIIAPSDGDLVIGVGAVDTALIPAYFSSAGPAADGSIKPNVTAMGLLTTLQTSSGTVGKLNGTSFSSPVLAGMAACLWQRYPNKTGVEIKNAIEQGSHLYNDPDSLSGYGVPNMKSASTILDPLVVENISVASKWKVYPNPVGDYLVLQYLGSSVGTEIDIELYTGTGQMVKKWIKPVSQTIRLNDIPAVSGILLLRIESTTHTETIKLTKAF